MNTRYNYFRTYRLTVRHDKGTAIITVTAQNKHDAAAKVERCENCPRSAIVSIIPVKG